VKTDAHHLARCARHSRSRQDRGAVLVGRRSHRSSILGGHRL